MGKKTEQGKECLFKLEKRVMILGEKRIIFITRMGANGMENIFFTVTGCNHYYGTEAFKPRMKVTLYKEPDNKYDKEAIRVEARALGKIGYVANSPYTVLGESRSAGRLYDLIDDGATGRVLYVLPQGLVCELEETGFEKVKKIYKKHRQY